MSGPLLRITTIARVTFTEALRQKTLNILLIFALVTMGSGFFLANLTFEAKIQSLKSTGFGAITVFGLLIALFSTAQMIPSELENRTIYTILAKPVRRLEFLLGKYLGVVTLLGAAVLLMSIVFAGELVIQEHFITQETLANAGPNPTEKDLEELAQIKKQEYDPRMLQALLLVFVKLCMTAGIALFISTFATSSVFTVATTFMIYLIGHLERFAREGWLEGEQHPAFLKTAFLGVISFLVPDMQAFDIIDNMLGGSEVVWGHTLFLAGYGIFYTVVILIIGMISFQGREL